MAAANGPATADGGTTPPSGQPIVASANLDDEWRQIEDDDWSSELVLSMDPEQQPGLQREQADPYPHRALRDSPSQMSIERGTQQAPANFSLLTRPTSAHEDPAAGFSFTKAKPVQPLDFSRKAASKANLSSTSIAPSTSLQKETQNGPRSQPETDERQVAASLAKSTSESRSSPKEASACKNLFAVPFPNVAGMSSQNCNPSFSHSKEEQDKLPPLSAAPAANEVSVSSDETLVELEVGETNAASDKANRSNNLRKPMPGSPESGKGPHIATDKAPRQQIKPLKTACLPTQAPRVQARVLSKATNKQRKKRPSASNQNANPTEGDLLQMLLYEHQQNDQERQVLLDTLQAKEAKYQELWAASEDLYSQYHDVSQKYSKSEGQLMKIKEAKPAWEKKIRKLSDYVKGLTNDHNRLRDDAKNIQERQQSVLTDKDSIFDTLRDVVKVTEERYSASKQQVTVARHDLEVLGKTVSNHQSQLHQEHALVLFERERNNRIEKQISTLTAGHAQLLITLTGHRDTITTNISEVLHSFEQVHATTPPSGQDSLKPMLEQCILSLKYLSERESGAKPADLQQLNDTMRQHFDDITSVITNCDHGATGFIEQQQRLESSVNDQLHKMSNDIATEHTLSEQIMDLREMKATIREQLHMTETTLQETRMELARLERRESEQSSKIMAFENDLRSRQPVEDPKSAMRLHELDTLNQDLRKDLIDKGTETSSMREQLQQKEEVIQQLRDQCLETHTELGEARQQIETLQLEKTLSQKAAVVEIEEMRLFLSKAADQELDDLKSKHLNAIQQLKLKKSPVEDKYKETSLQLIMMRQEKESYEMEAASANAALEAEKNQREDQAMYTHHLHQRLSKLEEQLKEQELAHGAFQQLLRDTELDNRAKDEYIKGMQTASTSSTIEAARSPAIPVAKVANASQARTPLIVEDSQPNDYPQFASHTDIMGDQGGSQVLGNNEDLIGLFPATPKEQGHNVEVSQITYSSSRVTSRDAISQVKRGPALMRPGSQVSVHSNRKNRPSSSARASQPGFPAPRSEPGISPIKLENRQQSSQISGSVPRGILKPVMRDPRGEKRDADESGTNTTAGFTTTKRRKSNMTKDLGPVVQDSQSPAKVISSRRRKQTTVRPKRKDDKFTRAFDERLN